MSALKIQVTTAGRAALVNAQNTGTLPVTVAKIGVTDQAFAADASLTALPGQLKQLDTFSGRAVASDTIHVTIRDFSTDTYSLRGFGLFLADGTLFAVFGDDSGAVILEKSAQAAMLLATDVIFADIDAAALTFGDTNFLNPPATTETQGVVELATDAEAIAGTDATRALTPKGLMAKLVDLLGAGAPSAFVKTLLTAASAAAFRVVLAIKGAALYDTGAGNGLDADLLDGQQGAYYRDYRNLQFVPETFTPAQHQHSAVDITTGTLTVARGGTGAGTFVAGNYLLGNGTGAFGSKTPAQVLADIGAATKVHSHAISDVNLLQQTLDDKVSSVVMQAALAGKVSTGSLQAAADPNMDNAPIGNWVSYAGTQLSNDGNNWPIIGSDGVARWWNVLTFGTSNRACQLAVHAYNTDSSKTRAFLRYRHDVTWYGWVELHHTGNFDPATKLDKAGGTNLGNMAFGVEETSGAQLRVYGNTPVGNDLSALPANVPQGLFLDGSGGVGAGGTLVFGATGRPFAYIKGYFTSGSGNGTGRIVIGTRTNAADANLTNKIIISENGDVNFSGKVSAPTAAAGTNTTQLATTAFVQAAIAAALANYLPKANPTFTGTMSGPAYNETE